MSALKFRPMFEVDTLRSISLGNLLALKGQQMKHWPHQALPENVSGSTQCVSSPRGRESFPKLSQLFKFQVFAE